MGSAELDLLSLAVLAGFGGLGLGVGLVLGVRLMGRLRGYVTGKDEPGENGHRSD